MSAKTPFAAAVLLAAFLATLDAQPSSVDTFRQLEQRLAAAYVKGDRQFVADLLSDDWTSTSYRGELWTKARVLAMFDGGGPAMTRTEIDVDRVRLFGDVAIVTGRSLSEGRVDDKPFSVVQRYTDVYVRRRGRWRIVASHGTQVQER